jgi:hypothetical protein
VLDAPFVRGEWERLLTRAFMIRAIVLMTLMPEAGVRDAVTALAGNLAGVHPTSRLDQAAIAPDPASAIRAEVRKES